MASQGFEIVDHTADIGIRVWGKDLKTLFLSAAKGMCSLLFEMDTVNSKRKVSLHVEAENPDIASTGLKDFLEDKHFALIETLKLLVRRKTFKATCPVCKDW